jgi:hypothetical protein
MSQYYSIIKINDIASIINQYVGFSTYYKKIFDKILLNIVDNDIQDKCYETTYTINQNFFSTKVGNVNSPNGFQVVEHNSGIYNTILDYNKKYVDCIIYSKY